ncbi:MAG: SAM-dependent methyltransferase [Clostridiales bacterium]|nr:SAM-dependent methyltransferase [Clostridiales bacterium]
MQLSKRMELLASKVTEGSRLADVGTDHGYIPIVLVQRKRIPSAIAMDVNKGPLERANAHIHTCGLDTYIETRLSDGLEKLKAEEADTVLIAGMGGGLTVRILKGGEHCLSTVKELILQPQSDIHLVREYLCRNHFRIVEEDMVLDEGKYYPMMKAVHGEAEEMDAAALFYGDRKLQKSPAVLREYIGAELQKNRKIRDTLLENGQGESLRMHELEEKHALLKSVLEQESDYEMQ